VVAAPQAVLLVARPQSLVERLEDVGRPGDGLQFLVERCGQQGGAVLAALGGFRREDDAAVPQLLGSQGRDVERPRSHEPLHLEPQHRQTPTGELRPPVYTVLPAWYREYSRSSRFRRLHSQDGSMAGPLSISLNGAVSPTG